MFNSLYPIVTAHTGCMNTPDNTTVSFVKGMESEADIVEIDARLTKDNIPVAFHNENLNGYVPYEAYINNSDYAQIKDVDIGSAAGSKYKGCCIPRLEEILDIACAKNKIINIDIKTFDVIDHAVNLIRKKDMADRVVFTGCSEEWALYIKKHYPEFQVLLNASDEMYRLSTVDYKAFVKAVCNSAIRSLCCGININHDFCKRELVEYAHLRCLPVWVWTVDNMEEVYEIWGMGVDSITTRDVEGLVKTLKSIVIP